MNTFVVVTRSEEVCEQKKNGEKPVQRDLQLKAVFINNAFLGTK